jgi:hypothetical protein
MLSNKPLTPARTDWSSYPKWELCQLEARKEPLDMQSPQINLKSLALEPHAQQER